MIDGPSSSVDASSSDSRLAIVKEFGRSERPTAGRVAVALSTACRTSQAIGNPSCLPDAAKPDASNRDTLKQRIRYSVKYRPPSKSELNESAKECKVFVQPSARHGPEITAGSDRDRHPRIKANHRQ